MADAGANNVVLRLVQLVAVVVMSAGTAVLLWSSWTTGSLNRSNDLQMYALAVTFGGVTLLTAIQALKALDTGLVLGQRSRSGGRVTRVETPTEFWMYLAIFAVLALAFAWGAVHIAGYAFGLWGWDIGT